jgi:hypothetical protein
VLRQELWRAAGAEQRAREEYDPWDDILVKVKGTVEQGTQRVESTELLGTVIGIHASRQRDIDFKRLGRCMRRLGWTGPKVLRIRGKPTNGYQRDKKEESCT